MTSENPLECITIRQPDDWHLHLRDGKILESVLACTARVFNRAIVMPNLVSPITSVDSAISYRERIISALSKGIEFTPLMTVYITEDLSPKELEKGFHMGVFKAAKLYPANATTNSNAGVRDLNSIDYLFETMERIDMPLLLHGEVTDNDVDVFDREMVFIDRFLTPLIKRFPRLRIVLEHITTEESVRFVESNSLNLAATITPHHLHINRNAMFEGGFRSDFYCLPIVKREIHRLALRKAAISGQPCFFLGTDSAPHLRASKENSCGCAGIFNAPNAIESYAEVFDEEDSMDKLEAFASEFGPKFYRLPLNKKKIRLVRKTHLVPDKYHLKSFQEEHLIPFHAGEFLKWKISEVF